MVALARTKSYASVMDTKRMLTPGGEKIKSLLAYIYGSDAAAGLAEETLDLLERYEAPIRRAAERGPSAPAEDSGSISLSERDAIVITYGDQLYGTAAPPLRYLERFFSEQLDGIVTGIHILPFFPYTSDDGFSISDYRAVNPEMGSWKEVNEIAERFRLMVDLVLNHCSAHHRWFAGFKRQEEPYRDYFITVPPGTDVSKVVRPRALPLLTEFETDAGSKLVWTTFSEDQVDLNFESPAVYLEMLEVLLFYMAQRRSDRASGCDCLPVEGTWNPMSPPSEDPRYGETVSYGNGPGRAARSDDYRNKCPARRQRELLRIGK